MSDSNPIAQSSVQPSGMLSLRRAKFASMLSENTAFTDRFPLAGDSETPEQRIYYSVARAFDLRSRRPYAVLELGEEFRMELIAVDTLWATGGVVLVLADNDHYPDDPANGPLDFDNWVGEVLEGIDQLNGQDGRPAITSIRMLRAPGLFSENFAAPLPAEDDFYYTAFAIEF